MKGELHGVRLVRTEFVHYGKYIAPSVAVACISLPESRVRFIFEYEIGGDKGNTFTAMLNALSGVPGRLVVPAFDLSAVPVVDSERRVVPNITLDGWQVDAEKPA